MNDDEKNALRKSTNKAQTIVATERHKTETATEQEVQQNLQNLAQADRDYFLQHINANKTPESEKFSDIGLQNGNRHYTGPLGDFEYDPNEFEIVYISKSPDPYYSDTTFPVLRYCGTETDGSKIKIPDGIKHIEFMFENTDIESMPEIPEGVESAFAAFHDCHQLKECNYDLPDSLEYAPFMFFECENLKYGPESCGENMKNMDYMFGECASLRHPIKIKDNVTSMNGTYIDCMSMSDPPEISDSVTQASNITVGCETLDQTMDQSEHDKWEAEHGKFKISKEERQTLGDHISHIASAWLETAALYKEGYYFGVSIFLTFLKREGPQSLGMGKEGKELSAGIRAVAEETQNKDVKEALTSLADNREISEINEKEERRERDENKWQAEHDFGMHKHKQAGHEKFLDGEKDAKSAFFLNYPNMNSVYALQYDHTKALDATIDGYTNQVKSDINMGKQATSESQKKEYARFYRDYLQDWAEYVEEATYTIQHSDEDAQTKAAKLQGLHDFQSDKMAHLLDVIQDMDTNEKLFNYGVKRDIDKLLQDMHYPSLFHTDESRTDARQFYDIQDQTDTQNFDPNAFQLG